MNDKPTRRDVLGNVVRGAALVGLGGVAAYLTRRASAEGAWQLDPELCVNSRLGAVGVDTCDRCALTCVLPLSAVRAVNDHAKCGRCYICPAYFDIKSAVNAQGLPSQKLCPRDAIVRKPIGEIDPSDPANNFYEYVIDEGLCIGCGKCVKGCNTFGNGSLFLQVHHDRCLHCNECAIAIACPSQAFRRVSADQAYLLKLREANG